MTYHRDPNTIPSALPFDYDQTTNFADWEQDHPGEPPPGSALDAEFANIEKAMDETQDRLALIQREDGALKNESVHEDALTNAAKQAIAQELFALTGTDPSASAIAAALSADAAADSADTATAQALLAAQANVDATAQAANALASAVAAANSASVFWKNAVVDFECVTDGVTETTDEVQASIDWAFTWGGTVYYPHGDYLVRNLSKVVSGAGVGPATFVGAGATPALAGPARGTRFIQPTGETGTLLTFQGDWGTNPNWPVQGIRMSGIALDTANTCAGWALHCFNVTMRHNSFTDMSVRARNTSAAGGILMDSCWGVTAKNIDLYGPGGTTSRGFVVYGSAGNGTTNQMCFENINCRNWGYCGAQLGKAQETAGGLMQGVSWTGGQCGTNGYYGMVIGRVLDYVIQTVHTENNGRNGFFFTADSNGAGTGSQHGRIVACDSFNDGQNSTAGDPTSYAIHVAVGRKIKFESFRFQQTKFAVYVTNADGVTDIEFDDITFGGKLVSAKAQTVTVTGATYAAGDAVTVVSNGSPFTFADINVFLVLDTQNADGEDQPRVWVTGYTDLTTVTGVLVDALPVALQGVATAYWARGSELSGTAFTMSSPTAHDDRIVTMGRHSFVYRWGNRIGGTDFAVFTNTAALTVKQENTAAPIVTALNADGELEVYPWTRRVRVTLATAGSITDIVAKGQYTLGAQQQIQLLFGDGDSTLLDVTSTPAGNFRLRQNRDWTPAQYDSIDLARNAGEFWETARNMNAQAGTATFAELSVADVTDNGSGLIRVETTAAHGWFTGMDVTVSGVAGTTEANGSWTITVIDTTRFDLQASAFVNPYSPASGTCWPERPPITNLTKVVFAENGATARSLTGFFSTPGKEVYEGQIVFMTTQATANLSVVDGSGTDDFATVGSATQTMLVNDTIGFLYRSSKWRQIPYSNN